MKITNKDICKQLKEMDGQDWQFGFGWFLISHPCFYVKGKSINDVCHEYKTQIPLKIKYNSPIDDESIEDHFENIDWKEVYQNSTLEYVPIEQSKCRIYKRESETNGYSLIFNSKRLEKAVGMAFEKAMKENSSKKEKADDGRGGK